VLPQEVKPLAHQKPNEFAFFFSLSFIPLGPAKPTTPLISSAHPFSKNGLE